MLVMGKGLCIDLISFLNWTALCGNHEEATRLRQEGLDLLSVDKFVILFSRGDYDISGCCLRFIIVFLGNNDSCL